MDKKKRELLNCLIERVREKGYGYYTYGIRDYFEEALRHERDYFLNCSDHPKDLSPEASMRRISNDIKRMIEKDGRRRRGR